MKRIFAGVDERFIVVVAMNWGYRPRYRPHYDEGAVLSRAKDFLRREARKSGKSVHEILAADVLSFSSTKVPQPPMWAPRATWCRWLPAAAALAPARVHAIRSAS